jgi:hypothetical protein
VEASVRFARDSEFPDESAVLRDVFK